MITKITKDNKSLYAALFEKASAELNLPADQAISSLDEYFYHLQELANDDDVYARLPLDEPFFEVDPETREIAIPKDFKANGVSVQGDQISETLYFSINRYFENIDLADEDNVKIAIQYKTAPDANKQVKTGWSPVFFRNKDVLAAQGKIIFGWCLDSNITAASGNVTFAIRFYKLDGENKLIFSLSTKNAQISINSALDYKFIPTTGNPDVDINAGSTVENIFKSRIVSSADPDDGTPSAVSDPTILYNMEAAAIIAATDNKRTIQEGEASVTYTLVDLDDSGKHLFKIFAVPTDDAGVISYCWKYASLGNDAINASTISGTEYWQATADTTVQANHTYYTLNAAGTVGTIVPIAAADIGKDIADLAGGKTWYERMSSYEAKKDSSIANSHATGKYFVEITSRVNKSRKTIGSAKIMIPGPAAMTVNLPEIALDSEYKAVFLDSTGNATLEAKASTSQAGDKIDYTWSLLDGDNAEVKETDAKKEQGVAQTYALPTVAPADMGAFDKMYSVSMVASRNLDSTNAQVKKFRVTDHAAVPVSVVPVEADIVRRAKGNGDYDPVEISATVNMGGHAYDHIIYIWHMYRADEEGVVDPAANDDNFEPIMDNNKFSATSAGKYYCEVKTILNGETSSAWRPADADLMKFITVSNA